MDSELRSRVSGIVEELAKQEHERLRAAGTFIELEDLVCEIGDEITRQLFGNELAERGNVADELAQSCPTCDCPCSRATPRQRRLLSSRGEVTYHEPAFYCQFCRRSFFPGSRVDGTSGPSHSDA